MTCLIDLNLFYIIIEIFNIKSLVTSIKPELFWFVKNFTFDYKPPSMSNNEFAEYFSRFVDRSLIHYEHMLLFGDLNFDRKSDLITVSRPLPYWFLSLRYTLYPFTLNRLSLKDLSRFGSEIINKSTMLSVSTSFISSNLYRRLLMFRCAAMNVWISEPNLDKSFNDNLFSVNGYKVQRRDRNQYGSGLLTVIRSDFPSSRKQSLESETIETLCHEVYISDRKWFAGHINPHRRLLMFRCAAMNVWDKISGHL
jgi:hypothetical protein